MKIGPGRIINDFIEPNKRQYAIPVYQRNYEWSKEQCVKLFDDIVQAYKKDKTHFCGSVVYAPLKEEHNIHYYVIIDGQQRLTTVYILIKALLDMAETDAERDAMKEALFNKDKFDTYDVDVASKLKLKPIKSDNSQLYLMMDGKMDEVDITSGIWRNYELFCKLIKERLEAGMYVKEIYKGVEKLTCASILLDADDNAQEIFERINSTGIPLGLADKIRNYVLMTDADQEKLYEDYWLPTEEAVRRENMASFFINYLNLKVDGFPREDEAYDVFKAVYTDGQYTNQQMLSEVLHYARYYKAFLFGDPKYGETVNTLLADLQKLKQTTVFLFLLRVFDDYEEHVIDQAELEKVLRFLLNYSIRRLICEIGSNSLRGLYKTLYARVFARPENKLHYYDALVSFMMQLTSKDTLPTDAAFRTALEQRNLYRKNALCKYLLTAIENQGKEQLLTDNLTVEHILPQNRNLSTAWQKMLGENWQADHDKYLHTLGNLTLTAYNGELGDKPFAEKKEKLAEVQTKVVTLYEDVKTCDRWDAAAIEARAKRLSGLVLGLFPTEKPTVSISFADPKYAEYSCDEPDEATYKAPNYYILLGERVNSTSFAEMLRSVVDRLYELDGSIIEGMARNDEKLNAWSQNVMFSYNPDQVNGEYKVKDTDIYQNVGFSAAHIIRNIAALLDKYDIDHTEFVYSAKITKSTPDKEDD
jgi:uncharacterized protein with ParB-like and HNH nuclease domain